MRSLDRTLLLLAVLIAASSLAQREAFEKSGQDEGKIGKSYDDSVEYWLSTPAAPPNVVIFLLDDIGFAHLGSFRRPFETPDIDHLAENDRKSCRAVREFARLPKGGIRSW